MSSIDATRDFEYAIIERYSLESALFELYQGESAAIPNVRSGWRRGGHEGAADQMASAKNLRWSLWIVRRTAKPNEPDESEAVTVCCFSILRASRSGKGGFVRLRGDRCTLARTLQRGLAGYLRSVMVRQAMLGEYLEDLNVAASLQTRRLVVSPRSYGDDFFGSSILMIPAISLLIVGNPEDVLSAVQGWSALFCFSCGCVGCVSINKTYDLYQFATLRPNRTHESRPYLFLNEGTGLFAETTSFTWLDLTIYWGIPLVIYVIYGDGCVLAQH
ncbi:MAG: hypothetical protein R3F21_02550 [Myxococcota bacterium]